MCFFFFKQKTAYEMRISDWSSDVCSSDLLLLLPNMSKAQEAEAAPEPATADAMPPAPAWLDELDALYDTSIRVPGLEDRTFSPEHWWEVALPLATQARGFQVEEVGSSAEGRPLRHVSWGDGHTPVLRGSQIDRTSVV